MDNFNKRLEKNVICGNNIFLEPRLQEYIKKKKFYKKNNVKPCVSLEMEFQITDLDKKTLKSFLAGKRNIYNDPDLDINNNTVIDIKDFPSKKFRNDPKYNKYYKKENPKPLTNMGLFVPDDNEAYYEHAPVDKGEIMDGRDLQTHGYKNYVKPKAKPAKNITCSPEGCINSENPGFRSTTAPSVHRGNPGGVAIERSECPGVTISPKLAELVDDDDLQYNDFRKYYGSKVISEELPRRSTRVDPKIDMINYNKYDKYSEQYSLLDRKTMDGMKKNKHDVLSREISGCDVGKKGRSREEMDSFYELETDMLRGIPLHTKRSYGYKNPSEHFFDYLEDEREFTISGIEPWERGGLGTRAVNRQKVDSSEEIMRRSVVNGYKIG